MNSNRLLLGALTGITLLLYSTFLTLHADPPRVPEKGAKVDSAEKSDSAGRISVAEARERAKLMHEIHAATLEAMHHHFFRRDRAVLPARAMEDVFAELDRQTKIKTRWIAVNTPAMSIEHQARTEFEKEAVTELSRGKAAFDRVVAGSYQRATAIPLGAGCLACHTRLDVRATGTPRVAGLVISIPVKDE